MCRGIVIGCLNHFDLVGEATCIAPGAFQWTSSGGFGFSD